MLIKKKKKKDPRLDLDPIHRDCLDVLGPGQKLSSTVFNTAAIGNTLKLYRIKLQKITCILIYSPIQGLPGQGETGGDGAACGEV